jgi:hypothetical protein
LVDDNLVLVQFCPDHIAAEVLAGFLRSESVPVVVRNLGPIPGLEPGAEVLVPASWLPRAQRLLAQQEPSDEELAELAARTLPEPPERA